MNDTLDLADYRRRVSDLYGAARGALDPVEAWAGWRRDRDALLATHPQSAVPAAQLSTFVGSPFFEYDPSWRLVAEVEPADSDTVMIDNSGTGATRFVRFGTAHANADGEPIALEVYWLDTYGGGLFLPFTDRTNGSQTYGGGRYLLDSAKGADLGGEGERLILDFNFAYHPSCVWDDRWSCPLAPPRNHLDVEVLAGERLST